MGKIFVSHAYADREIVSEFVDCLLIKGAGLRSDDLFYSSEGQSGVAPGDDLLPTVRDEVYNASLVIAFVTPTYQTRPVCIAELGAGWGRGPGILFPVWWGLERAELQGVLPGLKIERADEEDTLSVLFERLKESGRNIKLTDWSRGQRKWKKFLGSDPNVEQPKVPTAESVAALREESAKHKKTAETAVAARDELADRVDELEAQLEAAVAAKSASEASAIALPKDEKERYKILETRLRETLKRIPRAAREVVLYESAGLEVPPRLDDDYWHRDVEDAVDKQYLLPADVDTPPTTAQHPKVAKAVDAATAMATFFSELSEPYRAWFEETHDLPANWKNSDVRRLVAER